MVLPSGLRACRPKPVRAWTSVPLSEMGLIRRSDLSRSDFAQMSALRCQSVHSVLGNMGGATPSASTTTTRSVRLVSLRSRHFPGSSGSPDT